jgi:hypothetical protein
LQRHDALLDDIGLEEDLKGLAPRRTHNELVHMSMHPKSGEQHSPWIRHK